MLSTSRPKGLDLKTWPEDRVDINAVGARLKSCLVIPTLCSADNDVVATKSILTYFGYFGCVYPRSRKGHQISDHLDGE